MQRQLKQIRVIQQRRKMYGPVLARMKNMISQHDGAEMMVVSPAGNSPGFHITMTSRKRDASGKANSESDVSSNQRRQLRGFYVRGSWRSSWEASSSVQRDGSSSGLPDLSELPGWIQGPRGATHHSLGLLSLPALCFPMNRRNVGTWILEAVTHPGQEPSVAEWGLEPCEVQSAHCYFGDHLNTLISPCFSGGWSRPVHFISPFFDFHTCKEQARIFPPFRKYLIISF